MNDLQKTAICFSQRRGDAEYFGRIALRLPVSAMKHSIYPHCRARGAPQQPIARLGDHCHVDRPHRRSRRPGDARGPIPLRIAPAIGCFRGPYAPHQSARLGPCRLIVGVPTATARCIGPVSDPTNSAARRHKAANSIIDVAGASRACEPLAATIRSADGNSLGTPQTATLANPCVSARCRASSPYRSAGQSFDGQPAPGLSIANRPAASRPLRKYSSAIHASASASGKSNRTSGELIPTGRSKSR